MRGLVKEDLIDVPFEGVNLSYSVTSAKCEKN